MKIKTITCSYAYNYGAVLQTYALYKYIKDLGYSVEVIDYRPRYAKKCKNGNKIKNLIKPIVRLPDNIKGKCTFDKFLYNNINMTSKKYKNNEQLRAAKFDDDVFIVGSDQVWNCNMYNGYDDSFFLDFVEETHKKVSYAASIAMDKLNKEQQDRFNKMLKDFTGISVREKTAVKLLEESNVKEVEKVLDPVYLLSDEQWMEIANKEKKEDEKYILVYCFNGQKDVFEYARKKAQETGYKVYAVNTHYEDFSRDVDKYFWSVSPEKFLNLVLNSEMVVTNSFHGLSFSIIFGKEFKLFNKSGSGNSRMNDLMDEFAIEQCKYTGETKDIIKNKIEQSKDYINRVIKKGLI